MPTAHHENPKALEWADEFAGLDVNNAYASVRMPRLFYLWGHSFEYERNQNWELLEALCEKLANHSDIWYATNMEIHDYVTAYRSLIVSADNKMVCNPTVHRIWFDMDKKLYEISPGETLQLS